MPSGDAAKPETFLPGAVRVSKNRATGILGWRQDGRELYYINRDWEVLAVDITLEPSLQAGTPKV